MPAIVFSQVTKRYADGIEAVRDLNLTIADGEYFCLLGPSGCGKSSTLRMLAGLETVSEGEIAVAGQRFNDVPPQERDMAMVFENYALYPHLDVFGNIAMPLVARGRPRAEIAARVAAIAATLGLASMLKMRPYQLSGGQRQRVSVGRAIIREPKMFLLDEPLGHLEAYLRVQLRAEIRRLHERLGTTTVHITHDQQEAAAVADRIAVMKEGRLQQVGTIIDLLDAPANRFVAEFIGSPPINILPAAITEDGGSIVVRVDDTDIALSADRWGWLKGVKVEEPISLGIRPEDVSIVPADGSGGIPARVTALEPQGNESVLIADTAVGRLSLRLPSATAPEPGTNVRAVANSAKVHLFDSGGATLFARRGKVPGEPVR
jgi:multiple sugar transport system ATP-binding protein